MSLQDLLGLRDGLVGKRNQASDMAALEALERNEVDAEGLLKTKLPKMFSNDKITIPRVVDEYTRKDISMKFNKGTTTLAFTYKNGVVICADSRATGGQFIGSRTIRKIIPINRFLISTMAGGAADCQYWNRILSEQCRLYELRNRKPISVAAASKLMVNMIYNYKGMGLSLGVMICGLDSVKGPQIYMVDNDGRRILGQIFSVGSGSVYAYGVLDRGYKFDMSDEEAFELGRRAIFYAAHRDIASGGIVRVCVIQKDGWRYITEDDHTVLSDRYLSDKTLTLDH